MKHEWELVNEGHLGMINDPLRRCKKCKKEQRKTVQHSWMRVVGYRWMPLVGRCKGINTNEI